MSLELIWMVDPLTMGLWPAVEKNGVHGLKKAVAISAGGVGYCLGMRATVKVLRSL